MALTLTATAGSASANSYCLVTEADTYHEAHLYATTWNESANLPAKTQALVMATAHLDRYFEWTGIVATNTQALRWPRLEVYDRDGRLLSGTTIPTDLKNATAEYARWLLDSDRTAETSSGSGEVQRVKLGSMEVEYVAGTSSDTPVIPDAVVAMLTHLGTYRSGTGGAIIVRRA
jgi:DnaT-like ssDNA binding protein